MGRYCEKPVLRSWHLQEPITRGEQLPCATVMAFSRTSLFLERFWREILNIFKIPQINQLAKPTNQNIFCLLITVSLIFSAGLMQ